MAMRWEDISEPRDDTDVGPWPYHPPSKPTQPWPRQAEAVHPPKGKRRRGGKQKSRRTARPRATEPWVQTNAAAQSSDFLRSMVCGSRCRQTWATNCPRLDAEVYAFIKAIVRPDAHLRWAQLLTWQRGLQQRCRCYSFACPLWHRMVYGFDLALHLEACSPVWGLSSLNKFSRCHAVFDQVEAFVRALLDQSLPLGKLSDWQTHLRAVSCKVWLPRRLWYEAVHHLDLTVSRGEVQANVSRLRSWLP